MRIVGNIEFDSVIDRMYFFLSLFQLHNPLRFYFQPNIIVILFNEFGIPAIFLSHQPVILRKPFLIYKYKWMSFFFFHFIPTESISLSLSSREMSGSM